MKQNVILLSIDALRPDRLGCGGYQKISTPNIDDIARAGVTYDNCITASCLTPVSMASVMTAKYPSKHGLRDPFGRIDSTTAAELFKDKGYATAGFTGINFLSRRCGFDKGFDVWDEPTAETGWFQKQYKEEAKGDGEEMTTQWGNWWPPKLMKFMDDNKDKPFFIWGHYFEVHFHAEKWMLKQGMLEEGVNSENAYYDAKVEYLDKQVIGPINKYLKDNGLWDNTTIVLMSDHGETMMQDPTRKLTDMEVDHPKHRTMSQDDLRSTLIMKARLDLPGTRVSKLVRTVDVVPTLLDTCFGEGIFEADGQSLYKDFVSYPAYSEETFERRGAGSLQALQNDRFKLIRNNTTGEEHFYDLREDPREENNLINEAKYKRSFELCRRQLDKHKPDTSGSQLKPEEDKEVLRMLEELGYI